MAMLKMKQSGNFFHNKYRHLERQTSQTCNFFEELNIQLK